MFALLVHGSHLRNSPMKNQCLWELKALIISSQRPDLKSICGRSRRRERKSENIFNNLSHLMRLAEPLTQS